MPLSTRALYIIWAKWYYTWVTKAAQQGWVSGVGDGRFDPEGSVTFAQFALIPLKYLGGVM